VTVPATGSLVTGLYWHAGSPALTLTDHSGAARDLAARPGTSIGWRLSGPRRCIGLWLAHAGRRVSCPHHATLSAGGPDAQCTACATADRGRALARDATPEDPRAFLLYLAWFADGVLKVGLTATERGEDRLAEQGALAFTHLATGSLAAIRRAERTAAATGSARDRVQPHTKVAGWWQLDDPELRHHQLTTAHRALSDPQATRQGVQPTPCRVRDLTTTFGLDRVPPRPTHEVIRVDANNILRGELVCLAGRTALLSTERGPLLFDLRLLSGWTVEPSAEATRGVSVAPADWLQPRVAEHDVLF